MDILVKDVPKLPHATNKVLLRPHQMVQHEEDIRQCDADLANAGVKMKGIVRQRKKALEKQYLEQAPQPITDGALRDKVAKRINDLEEQIKVGLPTAEEMRKATNLTVEQHRKWERANKPKIKEWRNLLRQLNTDTSDPDTHDRSLGDIERLRPDERECGPATFQAHQVRELGFQSDRDKRQREPEIPQPGQQALGFLHHTRIECERKHERGNDESQYELGKAFPD